ncbi:MAG: hypothetical protein PVH64_13130 [Bacillota bacterium]
MKKISIVMTISLLLGLMANAAWGNAYTVKAVNGRILAPAGLGLNLSSDLVAGSGFTAEASYGIAQMVTLAAAWQQPNLSWEVPAFDGLQLKAYFSPTRDNSGYTAYLGYNPSRREFTDYGVSFWSNFRLLYAFVNLDFPNANRENDDSQLIRLTPGASLRLTPRLRVSAEVETDPSNWKAEAVRLGTGYQFHDRLTAKVGVSQGLADSKERAYTLGVALEM